MMNAKKTMEIGVFTGYSLLTTALALPEDDKLTSVEKVIDVILPMVQLNLRLLWTSPTIPKHSIISWMALRNRLPTLDRLSSWGIATDGVCKLCCDALESRDHIFFECPYSKQVWNEILRLCNLSRAVHKWNTELQWAVQKLKGKALISMVLRSNIALPVDEAQFLSMLVKTMNAKKTIEIGVFTCCSLLTTALALPEDGKILAIDIDKEAYEFGLPYIKKDGVERKINFIQSNALTALNDFVSSVSLVAQEEDEVEDEFMRSMTNFIREFNSFVAADPRVESSMLSIGDDVTLCKPIY
ncbi:hypothetical protein PTKIN_Ptkin09bG0250800 [Pterospermum kingtungense]